MLGVRRTGGRAAGPRGVTRLRRTAGAAVAVALTGWGLLAMAGVAAASWGYQSTPTVPGATTWGFNAVSCWSGTACMAVGNQGNPSGGLLTETRNDTAWTIRAITDPGSGNLNAISCTSASACTAVGSYSSGGGTVTLAEAWNGSAWSMQATPNPAGATSTTLTGVSCRSAGDCAAVGDSYNGSVTTTVAESWNGSHWTIQSTPNVGGATTSQLNGVSCVSATACTAVGYSSNGTGSPLAEVFNGSAWKIQPTQDPSGTFNELDSVSCPSATACIAVGDGFAEDWNGTAWAVHAIARAKDTLVSVSCVAATTCVAAGGYFDDGVQFMVAESWNGTKWRVINPPISTSFDTDELSGVACQNANQCTAVGSYHDPVDGYRTLAEIMQLRWQPQTATVPAGAIATGFDTVSCTSASACMAVGDYEAGDSTFDDFTETWNGGGWTVQPTPNSSNSNLSGVSCSAASACTAVGDVLSGGVLVTLAQRWNGTGWAVQATPNPAGAASSYLTSVSCPSATSCTATGFYRDGSGNQFPLAEAWNGSTWKIQTTPHPSGTTTTQFNTVSCASAGACVAVGYDLTPSFTPFAEVWNGTSWKIKDPSLPGGGSDGTLGGVSCSAATACAAVGDYFNGSKTVTLAERWNGTGWAVQTTPNRADAKDSYLAAVDCNSATSCTATGSVFHGGTVKTITLAERWDGTTWHLSAPGAPAGATQSNLTGVSCQTSTNCMGVGWYYDASGNEFPLFAPYN